jgi:hypothetical protein
MLAATSSAKVEASQEDRRAGTLTRSSIEYAARPSYPLNVAAVRERRFPRWQHRGSEGCSFGSYRYPAGMKVPERPLRRWQNSACLAERSRIVILLCLQYVSEILNPAFQVHALAAAHENDVSLSYA